MLYLFLLLANPNSKQTAARWIIAARLLREKRLCVSERRWRDHSNRMWCRAVHLCVCVQERGRGSLGVAGLTHTCTRAVLRKAALLTQPLLVVGPARQAAKELQTGMQLLSSATCVSVNVGFVPPQSLPHVDYLYLEQKADTSHILWACNQVHQRRRIFLCVDRSCSQNSCGNYSRKQPLILYVITNIQMVKTYRRPEGGVPSITWPGPCAVSFG